MHVRATLLRLLADTYLTFTTKCSNNESYKRRTEDMINRLLESDECKTFFDMFEKEFYAQFPKSKPDFLE